MSYQHLPEAEARERATKFTPERQQIKALVARGETREQIAAIIGVTASDLLEAGHQLTTTES
jgi:DNA-binding NarL/FixJ family response regulator